MPSLGKLVGTLPRNISTQYARRRVSSKFRQNFVNRVSSRFRQGFVNRPPGDVKISSKLSTNLGRCSPVSKKSFLSEAPPTPRLQPVAGVGPAPNLGAQYKFGTLRHSHSIIRKNPQIPLRTDSVPNLDTSQWTPKCRYVNLRAISRRESVEIAISKKRAPDIHGLVHREGMLHVTGQAGRRGRVPHGTKTMLLSN